MTKRTREIDKQCDRKRDEDFLQEILGPPITTTSTAMSNHDDIWLGSPFEPKFEPRRYHHQQLLQLRPQPTIGIIKKRRRLLPNETELLVRAFEQSQRPSPEVRDQLASRLRMSTRAIQIWFQNRRAKARRDASESSKASLSFGPPQSQPQVKTSVQNITPTNPDDNDMMVNPMIKCDQRRFQEIFSMPDLDTSWMSSMLPEMIGNDAYPSGYTTGSEEIGTPLTWDTTKDTNWSPSDDQSDAWMSQFITSSP